MKRYTVRTSVESTELRSSRTPYRVIDEHSGTIVDEYASKRAADMHARDLNRAERESTMTKTDVRERVRMIRGAASKIRNVQDLYVDPSSPYAQRAFAEALDVIDTLSASLRDALVEKQQ